jgi:hypothetical protein
MVVGDANDAFGARRIVSICAAVSSAYGAKVPALV